METDPPGKSRRPRWLPSTDSGRRFWKLATPAVGTVAVLSGVAQFVGPYTTSGLRSSILSTLVVAAGCVAIMLLVLLLNSRGRSVSMAWPKLLSLLAASFAAGILGGVLGFALRAGNTNKGEATPSS